MNDPMFFSEHVLPSGLRVFFQPRPIRWFGASLYVGCGQRDDPPGKEELAHLLEHCLSAGTRDIPYSGLTELQRWVAAQGFEADLGHTSVDYSWYGGKARSEDLEKFLRFLHALVLRPKLEGGLEHERRIVRNERRENSTVRQRIIERHRVQAIYGDHRLATALGWASDRTLAGLTMDDARSMHRARYRPANMALVVVGGLKEKALLDAADRVFSGRPGRVPEGRPPPEFVEPKPRERRHPKTHGKPASLRVRYYWPLPQGRRAALVLARNGLNELLMERVRERMAAVHDIDAGNDPYRDHEIFIVSAEVEPKKVGEVRRAIEEVVASPAYEAALLEALPRLKAEFATAACFQELTVDETLGKALMSINVMGRPRPIADAVADIAAVSEDDIRAFLRDRLALRKAYVEIIEE
jgi:predicted Zn-dependent peptidase